MMWVSKHKQPYTSTRRGFTIVELLIVIVVIAILAAITIVAYNGIQNRAKQSAAQQAVSQANKKVLAYAIQNSDMYPTSLTVAGITNTDGLQYSYDNDASPRTYGITATNGNFSYYLSSTVTSPTSGGYPGHGQNGVAAITNLITNPGAETSTANWAPSGGVTITRTSAWKSTGTYSFMLSASGTTNTGDMRIGNGGVTAFPFGTMQAGKTYSMTARVNEPVAFTGSYDRGPGILFWYSTNGSTWVEAHGPKVPNATGTQTASYTFTIPANATGALIGVGAASSTADQIVYYDSFMLTESSSPYTFRDGNSTDWAWEGTPNLSRSFGPPPQ